MMILIMPAQMKKAQTQKMRLKGDDSSLIDSIELVMQYHEILFNA